MLKRDKITICSNPERKTVVVEIFPERKEEPRDEIEAGQFEIDILRLKIENGRGQKRYFDMTLDEACEISQLLTTAVGVYLENFSKEYYKEVVSKKIQLDKLAKDERCRKSRKK